MSSGIAPLMNTLGLARAHVRRAASPAAQAQAAAAVMPLRRVPASMSRAQQREGSSEACASVGATASRRGSLVVAKAGANHSPSVVGASSATAQQDNGAKGQLYFGVTLFFWYFFNAVFAIFNKKTLNVFPYPWLLSWIQIACGAVFMAAVWALRIYPAPKVTWSMVRALIPVTVLHLIGHVAGCASYNFSSVSFMQIVKAAEPVVSVLCLRFLYGQRFPGSIYASLIPIVAGVGIVSATELNFSTAGFAAAMVSNFAFVFRNIKGKAAQTDIGLAGINLYAWMSILGTVLLLPFSLIMEGASIGRAFESAAAAFPTSKAVPFLWFGADTPFIAFLLTGGLFYHLYNQTSFMCLTGISPLTYSIANTVKRVVVIVAGLLVFRNPITPLNAGASCVAIFGTWLYSQAENKAKEDAKKASA